MRELARQADRILKSAVDLSVKCSSTKGLDEVMLVFMESMSSQSQKRMVAKREETLFKRRDVL